jgi:hypothetical protein
LKIQFFVLHCKIICILKRGNQSYRYRTVLCAVCCRTFKNNWQFKCNKQSYDKKEVGNLNSWEVKVEKDDKMVISLLGEFEKVRRILCHVLGTGLEKTRVFKKNNQPSGFFWVFLVFFWVFWVFFGFYCPEERVLGFFSVS